MSALTTDLSAALFIRVALITLVGGFCGAAGWWTWHAVITAIQSRRGA